MKSVAHAVGAALAVCVLVPSWIVLAAFGNRFARRRLPMVTIRAIPQYTNDQDTQPITLDDEQRLEIERIALDADRRHEEERAARERRMRELLDAIEEGGTAALVALREIVDVHVETIVERSDTSRAVRERLRLTRHGSPHRRITRHTTSPGGKTP